MANRYGQLVDSTRSGGLTVSEFWARLLQYNEMLWKTGVRFVLSDTQMGNLLVEAFPSREWSHGMRDAPRYRSSFNRGTLTGKIPKSLSFRYSRSETRVLRWEPGTPRKQWRSKRSVVDFSSRVTVQCVLDFVVPSVKGVSNGTCD